MNRTKLAIAIQEAERFLERARVTQSVDTGHYWETPKENGSVRRASMDLTRALADLRRSD